MEEQVCQEEQQEARREMGEFGTSVIRTERGTIHTLTIIGQVEGHQLLPPTVKTTKYEHILPLAEYGGWGY